MNCYLKLNHAKFLSSVVLVVSVTALAVAAAVHNDPSIRATKSRITAKSKKEMATGDQAQHYVEAAITFGNLISLEEVYSLPRAPGSNREIIKSENAVRIQIPAKSAASLLDRGVAVSVLREFTLVRGRSLKQNHAEPCSGASIQGSNTSDLVIPDDPVFVERVYSTITVTGASATAEVLCVDVHFEIVHTCVSDVEVDLSNQVFSIEYDLKDQSLGSCSGYYEDTVTGITAFAGEPVNQDWHLWAADWYPADRGVIDSWWIKIYYETFQAIPLVEGVPYEGTTRETEGTWHTYSPSSSGLLVLNTEGSELDTTLRVYDPCSLLELAFNDDVGDFDCRGDVWSQIMMPVVGEQSYLVRVAGFEGGEGAYKIMAELRLDELPSEPNRPLPWDGQVGVATHTRLRWNDAFHDPVVSLLKTRSVDSKPPTITPKAIYGNDDRVEEYDITDPDLRLAGDATVLIAERTFLAYDPCNQTYEMTELSTHAEQYASNSDGRTLCPDEPFRDQPVPGICTGFLVAPDIVATAGHCLSCPGDCSDYVFIFGFVMVDAFTATTVFDASEVYFCREVIGFLGGTPDWGLVRLDRAVVNVEPVQVRRTGKLADSQPLVVVGHPSGLPKKYDLGGIVRENEQLSYFSSNVDTYAGNSGSPVLNRETLEVEGILVGGSPDFEPVAGCDRSTVYPDDASSWEEITRVTSFSSLIPSYDLYLGASATDLVLIAENVVTPYASVTDLQKDTSYYWCVVARNVAGETKGPVWIFTTEP